MLSLYARDIMENLCRDSLIILLLHSCAVIAVSFVNFIQSFYRNTNYSISKRDKKYILNTTKNYVKRVLGKKIIPETSTIIDAGRPKALINISYETYFTNEVVEDNNDYIEGTDQNSTLSRFLGRKYLVVQMGNEKEYAYDDDGNAVELTPEILSLTKVETVIDKGAGILQEDVRHDTICGSYEKRNSLFIKQLLVLSSNLSVSCYMVAKNGDIASIISETWSTALLIISIFIIVITLLFLAAVCWQYICLKLCATTQMLVEALSKIGAKVSYVRTNTQRVPLNERIICWHAISVRLADIVVRSCQDGKDIYSLVQGEMVGKQLQCRFLKKDMEGSMCSISENVYKLAGSNLTGLIIFFVAVRSTTQNAGHIDGLFVVFVGLLLASMWYILVITGELVKYACFLNKLQGLTIDINLVGMRHGIDTSAESSSKAHESATLADKPKAWSSENDLNSKCRLRMRTNGSIASMKLE